MVLSHIAQRPGVVVVAGARTDAFRFGDRNLHVIHMLLVEQRLEDAVGEPQHEDVLDGLLAQVVIDSKDLRLVEQCCDFVVNSAGARQIVADRLLDDEARERRRLMRRDEPRPRELLHGRSEHLRRNCEVIDAIAGQSALVLDDIQPRAERCESLRVVERGAHEEQRLGEGVPRGLVERAARELHDSVLGEVTILVVGHGPAADADRGKSRGQQPVEEQVVERRQQLAMSEVTAAAENHEGQRVGCNRFGLANRESVEQRRLRHRAFSRRGRRTDCAAPPADVRRRDCPGASGIG